MPDFSHLVGTVVDAAKGSTDIVSLIKHAHWIVKIVMALLTVMLDDPTGYGRVIRAPSKTGDGRGR
mgnify:CR=1 FL=1